MHQNAFGGEWIKDGTWWEGSRTEGGERMGRDREGKETGRKVGGSRAHCKPVAYRGCIVLRPKIMCCFRKHVQKIGSVGRGFS